MLVFLLQRDFSALFLRHLDESDVSRLGRTCRALRCARRGLERDLVRSHVLCPYDLSTHARIGKRYFGPQQKKFLISRAVKAVVMYDFRMFFRFNVKQCFEDSSMSMASMRTYLLNGVERVRCECNETGVFSTLAGRRYLLSIRGAPEAYVYATHHRIPIQYPSADAKWMVQVIVRDLWFHALHSFAVKDDGVDADFTRMSPVLALALGEIGERPARWIRNIVEFDTLLLVDRVGSEEAVRRFFAERVALEN
jgi:hypothetical protein